MLSHVALKTLVCVLALSMASEAITFGEVVDQAKAAVEPIKAEVNKAIKDVVKGMHPMANVKEDSHSLVIEKPVHLGQDDKPKVEQPKIELPKIELPKINAETPKQVMDSMIKNLPPFLQSMFQAGEQKIAEVDKTIEQKIDEIKQGEQQQPQRPGGFFSILLLKKRPVEPVEDAQAPQPLEPINRPVKSLILFKISPKKEDEIDSPFNNLHLLGGGGPEDIDRKFFNAQEEAKKINQHLLGGGGEEDIDSLHHMQMTGQMDGDVEQRSPQQGPVMMPQIPFFNYFLNGKRPYLIPANERGERTDSREDDSSEEHDAPERHMGPRPTLILRPAPPSEQIKKCLMAHYMRVKASLYHRTVLFMLFMSGLVLFSLLVLLMALRNCRRRRAMRHFQGLMNVSAIDTKTFANAPPAYEQLTEKKPYLPPGEQSAVKNQILAARSPSSLVNSLAQAYRNRYTTLVNDRPVEGDNVSVSSLPNYEEHAAKSKNSTEQI